VQLSKLVRNAWLPLLIVAVVVIGGFTVARVKSFFVAENAGPLTSSRLDALDVGPQHDRPLGLPKPIGAKRR